MTKRRSWHLFLLLGLLLPPVCLAQVHEELTVTLIEVDVSALTSKGAPVLDLKQDDFALKVDGRHQAISNFSRLLDASSKTPLTILFLVDTSGSMKKGDLDIGRRIDLARNFARLALKEVKPGDVMQVFGFDVALRPLTPMTSDPAVVNEALSLVQVDPNADPKTALLSAVDLAAKELGHARGRRIIILCSDGVDNMPGPRVDDLLQALRRSGITVLALGTTAITDKALINWTAVPSSDGDRIPLSGPQGPGSMVARKPESDEEKKGKRLLTNLAADTGGSAFFPGEISEIDRALEKLHSVFLSQYVLAFKPGEAPAGWRKIDVSCKRKGVKLTYRKGYYNE